MQLTLVLGCLALVITMGVQRACGAFKSGSAYRQNWGFKRSGGNIANDLFKQRPDWLSAMLLTPSDQSASIPIPVREMVLQLTQDPELASYLVREFVDQNGDGFINEAEFLRRMK
ncbi:uncharacterized protein [Haliotis cracherodii]|uniref:uncharacterized protein n=1 Tax=Haliotis cracherodii TaxID=6455 RepID=UPI0039E7A305